MELSTPEDATSLVFSKSDVQAGSVDSLDQGVTDDGSETTDCHLENQVFTLVSSGGHQFVVVSAGTDAMNISGTDGMNISGTDLQQGGQSIALNIDDATRFLIQNQNMTNALMLPDGSYQILDQPMVQIEREDGTLESQTLHIEVLRALQENLSQQLPSIQSCYQIEGIDSLDEASSSSIIKIENASDGNADGTLNDEYLDDVSSSSIMKVMDEANSSSIIKVELRSGNNGDESVNDGYMDPSELTVKEETDVQNRRELSKGDNPRKKRRLQNKEFKKPMLKKDQEVKQPDLNSPIPLSDQTIIMVKGKKCVLAFNQETQQVCAYPLKPPPGAKRRGRPKLSEQEKSVKKTAPASVDLPAENISTTDKSTAAETLLELSNVGSDGVRRSARKRKKARLFDEYEELADSDEEVETPFVDSQEKDPDISIGTLEEKKKKVIATKKEPISPTVSVPSTSQPPAKRGRGRPRRYPLPGQQQTHTSIPAVMIPSVNGQTLVMAPIQGIPNLQNLHHQLPSLVHKPQTDTSAAPGISAEGVDTTALSLNPDTLPLDTSAVLDSNSIIPKALQGDTIPLVGDHDTSDHADSMDQPTSSMLTFITPTDPEKTKDGQSTGSVLSTNQATVIQIPNNLLASLGFKKDPVKIGLKATERELEKLKCPKCDFQGYYMQQYRSHIETHGDDIHKCKCCSYLSLEADDLLEHFKENHPRCICLECDFMAEHAYIIKRHMMRHDAKSCTCTQCGKVYKDMYILKMHIKMVHMPAEVLFECNVCSKKFTRKAHLKRHLRIHEPEKPYKCTLCDYRGCERSDISKHMLIHQDPKHACERCGKTFRHIKNKELHIKRHYGQRDYKCGVCDFFGYTFTDIRKHIERKHQDIKTLICDKCNKHLKSEQTLKEHQQTCNVMMIEQVLAIPTSAGGTSQATIQIPTNMGHGGQIILDSQAITMDGQTISMKKNGGVIMMSGEQQLVMTEGTEEEEELEDEEGGINQAMQIIGETIMTDTGEEMHIISEEALRDARHMASNVNIHHSLQQAHLIDQNGQILTPSGIQIFYKTEQSDDQGGDMLEEGKQLVDEHGNIISQGEDEEDMSHQFINKPDQPHPGDEILEVNIEDFQEVIKDKSLHSIDPNSVTDP